MRIIKKILITIFVMFFINIILNISNTKATTQFIENGIYEIETTINSNKVLDISAASLDEGANVQVWDKCNGGQQRFQITYLKDGYYSIKNINSGKVIDVKNAETKPGTNVQQWTSNGTDAQKWRIDKQSDGNYTIISKCNNLFLNVKNSNASNGVNIEVDNKKQTFNLKKITTIKGTKTIKDGYYIIATAIDGSKVLDVSAASKLSGANVQIWQNEYVAQQKYYIQYDGSGYYTIKNVNSGKVLDVKGGKTERGTNVQQWTANGTDAQKWVIKETLDGKYNIISKVSGIYLDVAGNKNLNGTNVQINFETNMANQKFSFIETKVGTKTIQNGLYEISTKLASNMLLDVSGGSSADGTNVQIWADSNEKQQKFEITYLENGSYKIICKRTGKALTVSNEGTAYSSNVFQKSYSGLGNQLWRIEKKTDGQYYIVSEYNGRYLDVASGNTNNGTNVRVYVPNFTNSQTFIFEQKKYGIDISHWQGTVNFDILSKSKAIDFMIIRAGHGLNIYDSQFERNYTEAKKYKIPLGVYLYANAQNIEETRKEANHLLDLIKNKSFELPIFYDVEAQENVDKNTITSMCNEFCTIIKNAGYKPGIYASKYYFLDKIYPNKLPSNCAIWVASYGKDDGAIPKDTYKYNGKWDIWQYTSTGRIDGINGNVDYDVSYKINY